MLTARQRFSQTELSFILPVMLFMVTLLPFLCAAKLKLPDELASGAKTVRELAGNLCSYFVFLLR